MKFLVSPSWVARSPNERAWQVQLATPLVSFEVNNENSSLASL